jgi:hypothetical protein
MKLDVVPGVAVLVGAEPVPPPWTPPVLLTTLAGPLPLGHLGASPLSSADDAAPP